MASGGAEKLKKRELRVGCKVINVEAFAYDIFVYSANKFGVPEECLPRWEGVTNDYGYADFIPVMTRFIFGIQLTSRHDWYKLFKRDNETNKFKSFGGIKSALPQILRETEGDKQGEGIHHRFFNSLAVFNDLILYLYTENYGLYLKELAKFWWTFWLRDKKSIDTVVSLENTYMLYSEPQEEALANFMNQFIEAHCIPYSEKRLKDLFINEYHKFFKVPKKSPEEKKRRLQAELARQSNLMRLLQYQAQTEVETTERDEASAIDLPRNPGLGIREHDAVLRNAMETDAVTSPQNIPSTSQVTESERRRTTSQKGKQKKETGSCSSVEDLERLNISPSAVDAATSPQNLPGTSQETGSERRRTTSQKGKQKKKTGSCSSVEDLERLNIGPSAVDAATSPQNLPSTSRQETVSNPIETCSQKKATSLYSEEGFGGLSLGFAKASLQNLPRTSRQETVSNPIETSSQKKATSLYSEEGFGGLKLGFAKASHQNLPRTSRQEIVSNPIETSSQKEEQKKATSRSSEEE